MSHQTFTIRIINSANNSSVTNDDIYITAKGQDPSETSGQEYFLSFTKNASTGSVLGNFVKPTTINTDYKSLSQKLSFFQQIDTNTFAFDLPQIRSCRVFISINAKLFFILTAGDNGVVTINEPSLTDPAYPNTTTLNDKFELTNLPSDSSAYVNTTAVDCFGLALKLQEPQAADPSPLGFIVKRTAVITELESQLTGDWSDLIVKSADQKTTLRVLSPAQAITGDHDFNSTYLDDYIDFVWWYYAQSGNSLKIDCSEVSADIKGLSSYIFEGTVTGDSFNFSNNGSLAVDTAQNMTVTKPTTRNVWACDGNLDTPDKTIRAVISKNLAASLNRGIIPAIVDTINDGFYTNSGVADQFYKNNAKMMDQGINTHNYPTVSSSGKSYFNLYASVLHESKLTTGGLYAFAYDDVGGQDSTLSDDNASYVEVYINDLSGTTIPVVSDKVDTSKVLFGFPTGDPVTDTLSYYNAKGDKIKASIGTVYTDITSPFKIEYGSTSIKEYTLDLDARSYDGLAVGLTLGFDFNGQTVTYIGLPPV